MAWQQQQQQQQQREHKEEQASKVATSEGQTLLLLSLESSASRPGLLYEQMIHSTKKQRVCQSCEIRE